MPGEELAERLGPVVRARRIGAVQDDELTRPDAAGCENVAPRGQRLALET